MRQLQENRSTDEYAPESQKKMLCKRQTSTNATTVRESRWYHFWRDLVVDVRAVKFFGEVTLVGGSVDEGKSVWMMRQAERRKSGREMVLVQVISRRLRRIEFL